MSGQPHKFEPRREEGWVELLVTLLHMFRAVVIWVLAIIIGWAIVVIPVVGILKILGSLGAALSGGVDHNFDP